MGLSTWAAHEDPKTRRYDEAWQAIGAGGAVGFGLGAWLGGRLPREQWRAVPLPRGSAP